MSVVVEPAGPRVRHTPMVRCLVRSAVSCAALVLVAGCGSSKAGSTVKVGQCPVDAPAVVSARTVATVDLSGDGHPDPVKLTALEGDCPGLLFARQGRGFVSAQLPIGGPPVSAAYGVTVPGRDGALLVTREDHPRGGFQLRVYAVGDDGLAELKVDGHSLVPFVVLDVQEHPLSVDCGDGGVVVTEATAHRPAGVAFAWDVTRTSYAVKGNAVTAAPPEKVEANVLPARLKAKYPQLLAHSAFAGCRAS